MNNLPAWLRSSQDPTEVANKIKGLILLGSSAITLFSAAFFHVRLSPNDIVSLGSELGAVAGSIWAIWGAILHLVTWVATVKSKQGSAVVSQDPAAPVI